jgi:hypothetical protein
MKVPSLNMWKGFKIIKYIKYHFKDKYYRKLLLILIGLIIQIDEEKIHKFTAVHQHS